MTGPVTPSLNIDGKGGGAQDLQQRIQGLATKRTSTLLETVKSDFQGVDLTPESRAVLTNKEISRARQENRISSLMLKGRCAIFGLFNLGLGGGMGGRFFSLSQMFDRMQWASGGMGAQILALNLISSSEGKKLLSSEEMKDRIFASIPDELLVLYSKDGEEGVGQLREVKEWLIEKYPELEMEDWVQSLGEKRPSIDKAEMYANESYDLGETTSSSSSSLEEFDSEESSEGQLRGKGVGSSLGDLFNFSVRDVEGEIAVISRENPTYSAEEVSSVFENQGEALSSEDVEAVWVKYGLETEEKRAKAFWENADQAAVNLSINKPTYDAVKVSQELNKRGIPVSSEDVKDIWKEYELDTYEKRSESLRKEVAAVVVDCAITNPAFTSQEVSKDLTSRGRSISAADVEGIWKHYGIETSTERLKVLKASMSQKMPVSTKEMLEVLEETKDVRKQALREKIEKESLIVKNTRLNGSEIEEID